MSSGDNDITDMINRLKLLEGRLRRARLALQGVNQRLLPSYSPQHGAYALRNPVSSDIMPYGHL